MRNKKIEPYFWILPSVIFFSIFVFYPFFKTLINSFFLMDKLGNRVEIRYFENFKYLLTDNRFLLSIVNTFKFALITVPISKIFALVLAIMSREKTKTSLIYETSFSLPMAMSTSVVAMIFQLLYVPSLGFINNLTGLNARWLTDPKLAMYSLAFIQIWLSLGHGYVFLLAAVRNVDKDILESSEIDGANFFTRMIHIYLPLVSPTLFYLFITDIAYSMMTMNLMSVLTDGGPNNSTMTVMLYIYKQISSTGNYTLANTASIILFIITAFFTYIGFIWEKKGVHY